MSQRPVSPLRIIRVLRGLTQADLADACAVSAATISNIERGHSNASPELVARLAAALGCDPTSILSDPLTVEALAGRSRRP